MDDILRDKRFSHIPKDPKFATIPTRERKVQIDSRFRKMFKDPKFKLKYSVDKRGRPISYTTKENLKKYYACDSDEEDVKPEQKPKQTKPKSTVVTSSGKFVVSSVSKKNTDDKIEAPKSSSGSSEESESEESSEDEDSSKDLMSKKVQDEEVDYARGEAVLSDSSSSDDDSSDDEQQSDAEAPIHSWGELNKMNSPGEADEDVAATRRLAVCNMDWDRVKARDILVILSSFCPTGGIILSVKVYPSDFGLQRMEEEKLSGPKELVELKETDDQEEDSELRREKLREYQIKRLRYYYAVAEFDSVETASVVLKECDNMEFESSATRLDIRFIPDDMAFDDRKPRDSSDGSTDVDNYEPNLFINTALQQVNVRCTWDENDPDRARAVKKAFTDSLNDNDVKVYLASSSDEEDDEQVADTLSDEELAESDRIQKYRSLLKEIEQKDEKKKDDVELEITWEPELKQKTTEIVSQKQKQQDLTPWETYLKKKKEKKKKEKQTFSDDELPDDVDMNDPFFQHSPSLSPTRVKEEDDDGEVEVKEEKQNHEGELELLLMGEDKERRHFSLKEMMEEESNKKKKKWKNKKKKVEGKANGDDFEVDVEDDRFNALYTSHHFNIDPSESAYKKTKGMQRIAQEKLKRREKHTHDTQPHDEPSKDHEMAALLNSVKQKSGSLKRKRK